MMYLDAERHREQGTLANTAIFYIIYTRFLVFIPIDGRCVRTSQTNGIYSQTAEEMLKV